MSLLRSLDQCTLDYGYTDHPRAYHVVVGFLCQLSRKASGIFDRLFDEIRGCCYAKRDRGQTFALMFTLTDHLGEMHKEIRFANKKIEQWMNLVSQTRHMETYR